MGAITKKDNNMKKTFFNHDSSARNDYRIIKLRAKLGYAGYGVFWAVLELLFAEENKLCIDDYDSLAFGLQCDANILKQVIEDFDLFVLDDGCFYSRRLNRQIEEINSKSKLAKENASKRWNNATAKPPHSNGIASKVEVNNSKSKLNNIKERISDFEKSVNTLEGFNEDDKKEFILYWTELNKSSTKMRWELQRTWSLPLRMKRWTSNGFSSSSKNKLPDYFDDVLYKKMDISAKKEYESHLKSLGYTYTYNPNSGGKWIKK